MSNVETRRFFSTCTLPCLQSFHSNSRAQQQHKFVHKYERVCPLSLTRHKKPQQVTNNYFRMQSTMSQKRSAHSANGKSTSRMFACPSFPEHRPSRLFCHPPWRYCGLYLFRQPCVIFRRLFQFYSFYACLSLTLSVFVPFSGRGCNIIRYTVKRTSVSFQRTLSPYTELPRAFPKKVVGFTFCCRHRDELSPPLLSEPLDKASIQTGSADFLSKESSGLFRVRAVNILAPGEFPRVLQAAGEQEGKWLCLQRDIRWLEGMSSAKKTLRDTCLNIWA